MPLSRTASSPRGLAEIVLYVVPAPGADGSAAVAAARERLSRALPPTSSPGGSKLPTICRARRPARSSAKASRATAARSALRPTVCHIRPWPPENSRSPLRAPLAAAGQARFGGVREVSIF
jgi:hypothetical protein